MRTISGQVFLALATGASVVALSGAALAGGHMGGHK